MIIRDLIDFARPLAGGQFVKDVRAGLGYTAVLLSEDGCGLAYTFRNELGCCCGTLDIAGNIIGMKAGELIEWAQDRDRLKAAMGLACINALLNKADDKWPKGNIAEAISLSKDDHFSMVGDFLPILNRIRTMTDNIHVFDRKDNTCKDYSPDREMEKYLPKSKLVLITATSLINHSLDSILPLCENAEEVCLVGLSTPLCPQVMKNYRITLLAGSIVVDTNKVLETASQGGGTMAMRPYLDQVLVRC